ncbi:hypothetical protein GIB67_024502 [Kingdonia uniflora]|uniref:Protein SHORTAGE IN CHIASMATA 1 n=1 Tax=Kingdonia uniflora TaxID=39325 RepID=A0A7J7LNN2_9MAGN|nr:hypothetical protein GIB67_024502 [Kingdonia uniflora]
MRTRFLNVDFFTHSSSKETSSSSLDHLQFLRLPLPNISNSTILIEDQPDLLCFGPKLNLSLELDRFPIENVLSQFFSDVLPQKIDIIDPHVCCGREEQRRFGDQSTEIRFVDDDEKRALVPYEDGDVEVKRLDGSDEEKGKRSLDAIQFETPELNFILEEQCVNVFDDEQQQAFSGIPQLELPLSIQNDNFSDTIPYPYSVSELVYSVQDINLDCHIQEDSGYTKEKTCVHSSKWPILEVNEIGLETYIGPSIEENLHLLLEVVQCQQWTEKDHLIIADGNELLGSIDPNSLKLLPKHYPSLLEQVEPTPMCLNAVLEMEFRGPRKITQLTAGNSKEISEGVYFSQISPVHFQEVHILDVDTCHSFEVFLGIQTTKELETCEQMLLEGMESFYESIISHELALVDDSFKSLPIPHLPNDNEIWSLSSVVEGILSDLKPHPPSASDGIYLDWHLLQEDRCSNENCSTYWNIFEEIDYITVIQTMSLSNDMLVIDFVFWNDTSNGLSKNLESKELLKCPLPDLCRSQLLIDESRKTGKTKTADKAPDILKCIPQFNDLEFFLNPLKGTARKHSTEAELPVDSSSNLAATSASKDLTFLRGELGDFSVPGALCDGADVPKDTQLKADRMSKNVNDQEFKELLRFLPIEEKQKSTVSSEPAHNTKACRVPISVSSMPFAMGSDQSQTRMPSFPDIVVIVNTQDFGKEMLISRRSSYQKILAMEKGGAQVVEREIELPVDLIFSAAICLVWYNCRNIGENTTTKEASSCFPLCVENIATNILTSLSFAFSNCILIFEGESKFLYSIMELSDELYAAAASLGVDLQLFCSYSPEFTDEIILSCINYSIKLNRGLYPKMLDSENLAETFLTKFPSINPLSAHAILSSGGRLVEFLEWSCDHRIQAIRKYGVSDESIALFNALCKYGEQEDSKSGTTDCSSGSFVPDSGNSSSNLESPRKKQKCIGRPPSAKAPRVYQPLESWFSSKSYGVLDENHEIEISKFTLNDEFFEQTPGLADGMVNDLGWNGKARSEKADFRGEVIDLGNTSFLGEDFSPIPSNAFFSPEFGRGTSFGGSLNKRVSPPIPSSNCPSYPTSAEITSNSEKSSKDHNQMFNEDFWDDIHIKDDNKDDIPLQLRRLFLQEEITPRSTSSYGGTPLSNAIHSSKLQQGSPWTVEFLNKIKEKSRMHQKSRLSDTTDACYGYPNSVEKIAKRKSPSTLDCYRYQGGGRNPKRIFKQKCQKQQLIPQLFGSYKSEKASCSLTPEYTPTDKRASQKLSFARMGKEKQSKLIWSDGKYPGSLWEERLK